MKFPGIDPMGVLGSGELCQVVLHHHPALHRAVAQLAAFGGSFPSDPIRNDGPSHASEVGAGGPEASARGAKCWG